jgi:hypothetical protein
MLHHLVPERGSQVAQLRGELAVGKEGIRALEPAQALQRGRLRLREQPK